MTTTAAPSPQSPPPPGRRLAHRAYLRKGSAAAVLAASALGCAAVVPSAASAAATPSTTVQSKAVGGRWVVVTAAGRTRSVVNAVVAAGGTVANSLPTLDMIVVTGISPRSLGSEPGVISVTPDVTLSGRSADWGDGSAPVATDGFGATPLTTDAPAASPTPDPAATASAAPAPSVGLAAAEDAMNVRSAWSRTTGRGIDVALIDTGIAPVAGLTGPGKVVNGPDLSFESQAANRRYVDNNGHGTHMAGIIAGNDFQGTGLTRRTSMLIANGNTSVIGVAPSARLVNVKVGDGHGVTDVSQVLAGIDWVVQHAHDPNGGDGTGLNIRVLNISYGTDSTQPAAIDPLAHAAEVAWHSGIVVVASAGNNGDTQGRLADPAVDPYLIAVGAAETSVSGSLSDDTVPGFSSRGDGVRDPDVVAPGVHIASLRDPGGDIDQAFTAGPSDNPRLIRGSGTSQATAMISGAAALLLSARPYLTPDQVKALLVSSARPVPGANHRAAGAGLVDVQRAVRAWTPNAVQTFPPGAGGGSLDGARGSHRVMLDGVALAGEQDIFGVPFDASAVAGAEESQAAWTDGTWNGSSWAGSSWAGSSWAGSSWAGSSWAGSSWAGSSWAGSSWAGYRWGDPAAPEQAGSWGGAGEGGASWS